MRGLGDLHAVRTEQLQFQLGIQDIAGAGLRPGSEVCAVGRGIPTIAMRTFLPFTTFTTMVLVVPAGKVAGDT